MIRIPCQRKILSNNSIFQIFMLFINVFLKQSYFYAGTSRYIPSELDIRSIRSMQSPLLQIIRIRRFRFFSDFIVVHRLGR